MGRHTVADIVDAEPHHLHLSLKTVFVLLEPPAPQQQREKDDGNEHSTPGEIEIVVLLLYDKLMVEHERILTESEKHLRRPHDLSVSSRRIFHGTLSLESEEGSTVVAHPLIVIHKIAVAYVDNVFVYGDVEVFISQHLLNIYGGHATGSHPYAYGVGIIDTHRHIHFLEELLCSFEIVSSLFHLSEIEIDVGHVDHTDSHVDAVFLLALKELLHLTEHRKRLLILLDEIVVVASTTEVEHLHIGRHHVEESFAEGEIMEGLFKVLHTQIDAGDT